MFSLTPHHKASSASNPIKSVQLPRTLARPAFAEVSREAIIAAAPELANIPTEYIRAFLRSKSMQMLVGNASLSPAHLPSSMSKSSLPPALSIPIQSSSNSPVHPIYPTQILAVTCSSTTSSSFTDHATLFPIHNIILASQCSALPRLPRTESRLSNGVLNIPVLPISLPSPAAFKIIHAYLYNHSLEGVLKSLFPIPSGFVQEISHHMVKSTLSSGTTLHQLSTYLCASAGSNVQILVTHAAHVKELWQDVVALGIYDPELWDTLDLGWEIILGALNLVTAGY